MEAETYSGSRNLPGIAPGRILRYSIILILSVMGMSGLCYHLFHYDAINLLPDHPVCYFRILTGIECPGCGMTRALIRLGQLRIGQAFQFNIYSIPLFLSMLYFAFLGGMPRWIRHRSVSLSMLILVLCIWVFQLT